MPNNRDHNPPNLKFRIYPDDVEEQLFIEYFKQIVITANPDDHTGAVKRLMDMIRDWNEHGFWTFAA